ncbi:TRAP transporter small permease [Marivita sp. GX14005]|uniref:TRAP transporter small permease n=1 Tax=Marivita sp. GX14005 TaxID=2942276 RepID=UPI00201A09F5|nr:TRAP transporter small permease [Marivita sp. GX14005]MCL3882917.1 TRAP transporter small permease [Marivita sp. GX14005]
MDTLRLIDRNAERWMLLVFYVMLVITMAIEVLRREVFSYSSIWGEEVVRYAFIYLAWIGASAAVKDRAHIRIDVIMHYLGRRMKALLYMLGDIVMFAVAIVALYWSLETVHVSLNFGSVTAGLRVSQAWALMAVPLGFALMMWRLIQSFIRDFKALRDGTDVYEGDTLFD